MAPQLASRAPAVALPRALPEERSIRPHLAWLCQRPPPLCLERRQPVRRCSLPLRGPDDEATDASCRAPPPGLAGWRAGREEPRTLSTGSTPMPPFPRPEAPSTDGSLSLRPLLALRTKLPGRHWSLWLGRQGPASDTRSLVQVRARSCPVAGYSPELARPRAAHRLLQLYGLLSTTTDVQTPSAHLMRRSSRRAEGDNAPKSAANQAFSAQG